MTELFSKWTDLGERLGLSKDLIAEQWQIWLKHYEAKGRAYHNLSHLAAMLAELETWPEPIHDPTSIELAIWFHDLIYQASRKDNEEKSAQKALEALPQWNYPAERIDKIASMIRATAGHKADGLDNDARVFLDLDLSILGRERTVYETYIKAIRKEYRIYPTFLYRKGRKQVLQHFLERETLYFTAIGQKRWEKKARENLSWELKQLK